MLSVLVLLLGCSDHSLQKHNDVGGRNDIPLIAVSPDSLDFGEREPSEEIELVFTVTNEGTENSVLDVDSIEFVTGEGEGFALVDAESDFRLLRGESRAFTVRFIPPLPGDLAGEIVVKSNDDSNPAVPVYLNGVGLMPYLEVTPNPLDFGEVLVECSRENNFTLTNVGNMELVVDSIASVGNGFTLIERPALPDRLAPGDSVPVTVGFAPDNEAAFNGSLVVGSNDPRGEQRPVQQGSGIFAGYYEEWHTVPPPGPVTLIMAVDQSNSMTDDQAALARQAETLAASLSASTDDWRIMVLTRDDGCNSGGIMTQDTENFAAAFTAAVQDGDEGYNSEKLMAMALSAMQQTGDGECNDGILDNDEGRLWHFVYVTDEDEQSPERWDYYVNAFAVLKGDEYLVKHSAIAGDVPNGCESDGNTATPARKYYEAVTDTYGRFFSICSDWAGDLDALARIGVTMDTFGPLAHDPDPRSIYVEVNGVDRTSDTRYYGDSNTVVFTANPPQSYDEVFISYDIPFSCD